MERVLYIAQEHAGPTKVGGFGDAAVAMGEGMKNVKGVDFAFVMPGTPLFLKYLSFSDTTRAAIDAHIAGGDPDLKVFKGQTPTGSPAYVAISEETLKCVSGSIYNNVDGLRAPDGHRMSKILGDAALLIAEQDPATPTVIHLNDFFCAPAAAWAQETAMDHVRIVSSIHVLKNHDMYPAAANEVLPPSAQQPGAGKISFWEVQILNSDIVTTVSEHYAREVQRDGGVYSDLLSAKGVSGVLNGVNITLWNPQTCDDGSWHTYGPSDLDMKKLNKSLLLAECGIEDKGQPVVSFIHRLDPRQKGTREFVAAIPALLEQGATVVIHGVGTPTWEGYGELMQELDRIKGQGNPDLALFIDSYSDGMARRILAGSDIHATTSSFEPGGYSNMHAMFFGNVPVVTPTGGLLDTVRDVQKHPGKGNGFVAENFTPAAVEEKLTAAVRLYQEDPMHFRALQLRAMQSVPTMTDMAHGYVRLYRQAFSAPVSSPEPVSAPLLKASVG